MADIEQRIVELSLDSKNLEKNAKTSIQALEKLDDALKFSGAKQSMDELQAAVNSVDFSKLSDNIDDINRKLSAVGVIKGTIVKNLTEGAIGLGKSLIKPINDLLNPVTLLNKAVKQMETGGWSRATKIDQAKFKMEGLKIAWANVEKQINYGVKDTAYGLDQAANAAAQLLASGVKFSKSFDEANPDLLAKSLRAISGVAAMTSADYDLLADVFIDAAAAGKVTADTFNRISAQGLNAKADIAKEFGKTSEEIDKMARKGEISFEMLAEAMDKLYGEQATKSNETFEGALSNMKFALSKIGAEFATPLRAAGRDIFNEVRLQINKLKKMLGNEEGAHIFEKFTSIVEKGSKMVTKVIRAIPVEFLQGIIDRASVALDVVGGLLDSLDAWLSKIPWIANQEEKAANEAANAVEGIVYSEEHITEMANRVINGEFGNGDERRKALEELGECYEIVQNKVNELLDDDFRYAVTEEMMAKYHKDEADSIEETTSAMDDLAKAREIAKGKLTGFTEQFTKGANKSKIQEIILGLASAFEVLGKTAASIASGAMDAVFDIATMIGQGFLDAASSIGTWITSLHATLTASGFYEKLQNKVNKASTFFVARLKDIGKFGKVGFGFVKEGASKVKTALGQAKEKASGFLEEFKKTEAYARGSDIFGKLKDKILALKDEALAGLTSALEKFTSGEIKFPEFDVSKFTEAVSEKIVWLLDKIQEIKDSITTYFSTEGTIGNSIFTWISDTFGDLTFQSAIDWAIDKFGLLKEALKDFISLFTGAEVSASELEDSSEGVKREVSNFDVISEWMNKPMSPQNNLKSFIDKVKQIFNDLKTTIEENIDPAMKSAEEIIGKVFDKVKTILTPIITWFVDMQILTGLGTGVKGIGRIFKGLGKFTEEAAKIPENIAKIPESIAGLLDNVGESVKNFMGNLGDILESLGKNVGKLVKAKARLTNAKALLVFAAAIAVLVGAIWVLGTQLTPTQTGRALKVIVVIGLILAIALVALGSVMNKASVLGKPADKAAEVLESLKDVVGKFLKTIGKASVIIAIGAAVALIGGVVAKLSGISFIDGLKGIFFTGLILAGLLGAMTYIDKLGQDGKGTAFKMATAFIMLFMAFAVKLLAGSVEKLGKMDLGSLAKGVGAVVALMAVLAWSVKEINSVGDAETKGDAKKKASNLLTMIGIIIAIKVLTSSVKDLGNMDIGSLAKGIGAVVLLMNFLKGVIKSTENMKAGGFGTLLGIAVAVGVLAASVKILGKMKLMDLVKGVSVVAILGVVLKGMIKSMSEVGNGKAALLSAFSVLIMLGSIVGALWILTNLDSKKLKQAARSLSLTMSSISLTFGYMMKNTKGATFKDMLVTLIPLVAVIGIVSYALYKLAQLDATKVSKVSKALTKIFLAITLFVKSTTKLKINGKDSKWGPIIAYFVGVAAIVAEVAGLLYLLTENISDPDSALKIATAMSELFAALGILFAGIGQIGGSGTMFGAGNTFLTGLAQGGVAATIVAAIIAIGEILDQLDYSLMKVDANGNKTEEFRDGFETLIEIGRLIGRFVGTILEEALFKPIANTFSGFSSGFDDFCTSLMDLVNGLSGGEDGESGIDKLETALDDINRIITAIGEVSWEALKAGFISVFANNTQGEIITFMQNLEAFIPEAQKLAGVADGMDDISEDGAAYLVDNIQPIADILAALGSVGIVSIGTGFVSWVVNHLDFIGELTDFTDNLTTLGGNCYKLVSAFNTIPGDKPNSGDVVRLSEDIQVIKDIVKAVQDTADMSEYGGWGSFISANLTYDDMEKFVKQLAGTDGNGGIAQPAYDLANAFFNDIEDYGLGGKLFAPWLLASKIKVVKAVIEAIGEAGWVSQGAGFQAGEAIEDNAVENIRTFCTNLAKIAVPAYGLAAAFYKEVGTAETGDPNVLAGKIKTVGTVLIAIRDAGFTANNTIEAVTDTLDGLGNIQAFCTNLTDIAPHVYNLAAAFEADVKAPNGATISGSEEMYDKLQIINNVLVAISDAGLNVDISGGRSKLAGEKGSITDLITFLGRLKAVARPVYALAYAFQTQILNGPYGSVEMTLAQVEPLIGTINAVIVAIGNLGWSTQTAAGEYGVLGTESSISEIQQFCINLSAIASDVYGLAQSLSYITIDENTTINTDPEQIKQKIETIGQVISGIGGVGWDTLGAGISTGIGGADWSINNITNFTEKLAELAPSLNALAEHVNDDLTDSEDEAIKALYAEKDTIKELEKNMQIFEPLFNAISSIAGISYAAEGFSFAGLTNIVEGTDSIKRIGDAMVAYDTAVKTFSPEDLMKKNEQIATIIGTLNSTEYWAAFNVGDLTDNLPQFGTNLKTFATNVSGIDYSHANQLMLDLKSMAQVANEVYELVGIANAAGSYDVNSFSVMEDDLVHVFNLVDALIGEKGMFGDTVRSIGETLFGNLFSDDKSFTGSGENAGGSFVEGFKTKISDSGATIMGALDVLLNNEEGGIIPYVLGKVDDSQSNFVVSTENILKAIQEKVLNSRWILTEAIATVLNSMVRIANTFITDFEKVGENFMNGMNKGINKVYDETVKPNIEAKAQESVDALNEKIDANSPSKKTELSGQWFMQGFAKGINKDSYLAEEAVQAAAVDTLGTLATSMSSVEREQQTAVTELLTNLAGFYSYVNAIINDSLDYQPTITPVMDLSMIQNGVNGINSMLYNGQYAFGANGLAYARNMYPGTYSYAELQAQNQNNPNSIEGIRAEIRNLGESIQNMQMVLDSGQLIGSIGGGMDRELGSIQRMKERWA